MTGDGIVNIFDLVEVASQFGQSGENLSGDVNSDGTVNIFDLVEIASHFGEEAVVAAPTDGFCATHARFRLAQQLGICYTF
ncbi:MAG: hypothetical protein O7E52_27890 [Candidatus Poribacteria bacterium]|nr:hypothetical protein [Candidatus Poribacteria bacterium]